MRGLPAVPERDSASAMQCLCLCACYRCPVLPACNDVLRCRCDVAADCGQLCDDEGNYDAGTMRRRRIKSEGTARESRESERLLDIIKLSWSNGGRVRPHSLSRSLSVWSAVRFHIFIAYERIFCFACPQAGAQGGASETRWAPIIMGFYRLHQAQA